MLSIQLVIFGIYCEKFRKIGVEIGYGTFVDLCGFLEPVVKAIEMRKFKDFEDCLQDRCAKSVDAKYIITRNVADFSNSEVTAILPEDFLKIWESKK